MINSYKPSLYGSIDTMALGIMKAMIGNSFQDVLSGASSKTEGTGRKRKERREEGRKKKRREIRKRKTKEPLFAKGEDLTLALQSGVLVGHWRNQTVPTRETNVHREMFCVQSRGGVGRTCSLLHN